MLVHAWDRGAGIACLAFSSTSGVVYGMEVNVGHWYRVARVGRLGLGTCAVPSEDTSEGKLGRWLAVDGSVVRLPARATRG